MTNPFLSGHFEPLADELDSRPIEVDGKLPDALSGILLRNGPNPKYAPTGDYHYFDGDGMVHALNFSAGAVSYQRRFVSTPGLREEITAGRALFGGLLDPLSPRAEQKNPANTSILGFNNKCLALWERGKPFELDCESLQTIGEFDFDGQLTHPFTAHPKIDPRSGELFCFGYRTLLAPFLQYSVFTADGKLRHSTSIELPCGVMMHDFAITESHVIFLDLPFTFSTTNLRAGKPLGNFDRGAVARIGVLPRYADGGAIRWFDIDPAYVFHVVNAFEVNDGIVLDVLRYRDLDMPVHPPAGYTVDHESLLRTSVEEPLPFRYRLGMDSGEVEERQLFDTACEFPVINPRVTGRPYRYFYAASLSRDTLLPEGMGWLKHDLETGKTTAYQHEAHVTGGEAVFIPDANAGNEDSGWLLGLVHNDLDGRGECLLLDARQPDAGPVARLRLPERLPQGLHAAWFPRSRRVE